MGTGRQQEIHDETDRKLEEARKRRQARRQNAAGRKMSTRSESQVKWITFGWPTIHPRPYDLRVGSARAGC